MVEKKSTTKTAAKKTATKKAPVAKKTTAAKKDVLYLNAENAGFLPLVHAGKQSHFHRPQGKRFRTMERIRPGRRPDAEKQHPHLRHHGHRYGHRRVCRVANGPYGRHGHADPRLHGNRHHLRQYGRPGQHSHDAHRPCRAHGLGNGRGGQHDCHSLQPLFRPAFRRHQRAWEHDLLQLRPPGPQHGAMGNGNPAPALRL